MKRGNYLLEDRKEEVKKLYFNSTLSLTKIGEYLGVSRQTVTNFVKKEGWYIEGFKSRGIRKYAINEDFFSQIKTEKQAYWLGFIAADGSIRQDKMCLTIELARKDKEHLEKFLRDIESEGHIFDCERSNSGYLSSVVKINSLKICNDLCSYGIVPHKTGNLYFSFNRIPESLIKDFIRGYFDGNGCICYSGAWAISCSGYLPFLLEVMKYLPATLTSQDFTTYGTISTSKKSSVINTLSYLYKDSIIYLERKYKKYCECLLALNDYQGATYKS